ncbi:hypothetical protein [Haloplanus salilacus]|uniref:hypothetical protein n=1 Tax=Haloplanus salilacus TaxID=2949994 RepID=UPI0030CBFF41
MSDGPESLDGRSDAGREAVTRAIRDAAREARGVPVVETVPDAVDRVPFGDATPELWSAVADGCLVDPAAGAAVAPALAEGLYYEAAPQVARALAHVGADTPAAVRSAVPRLAQLLAEQERFVAVTERHPGRPAEAATVVPAVMAFGALALTDELYAPAAVRHLVEALESVPGIRDEDWDGLDAFSVVDDPSSVTVTADRGRERPADRPEAVVGVSLGWLATQHPRHRSTLAAWAAGDRHDPLLRRIGLRALGTVARCVDDPDRIDLDGLVDPVAATAAHATATPELGWLATRQLRVFLDHVEERETGRVIEAGLRRPLTDLVETRASRSAPPERQRYTATLAALLGRLHARRSPTDAAALRRRAVEAFETAGLSADAAAVLADLWVVVPGRLQRRDVVPWERLVTGLSGSVWAGVHQDTPASFVRRVERELATRFADAVTTHPGVVPTAVGLADGDHAGVRRFGTGLLLRVGSDWAFDGDFSPGPGPETEPMAPVAAATPTLARRLRTDPDSRVRANAANALYYVARSHTDRVVAHVDPIHRGLRDADPHVREHASTVLWALLEEHLGRHGVTPDGTPQVVERLRGTLPDVVALFGDPAVRVRAEAVKVVLRLAPFAPERVATYAPQIRNGLTADSRLVARRTATTLGHVAPAAPDSVRPAVPTLRSIVRDGDRDGSVRSAAAVTLATVGDVVDDAAIRDDGVAHLRDRLTDVAETDGIPSMAPFCRLATGRPAVAAELLPEYVAATETLVSTVGDAQSGGPFSAQPALRCACHGLAAVVGEVRADADAPIPDRSLERSAVDTLADAVAVPDPGVRADACRALGHLGGERALSILREQRGNVVDHDHAVARAIARIEARSGD